MIKRFESFAVFTSPHRRTVIYWWFAIACENDFKRRLTWVECSAVWRGDWAIVCAMFQLGRLDLQEWARVCIVPPEFIDKCWTEKETRQTASRRERVRVKFTLQSRKERDRERERTRRRGSRLPVQQWEHDRSPTEMRSEFLFHSLHRVMIYNDSRNLVN